MVLWEVGADDSLLMGAVGRYRRDFWRMLKKYLLHLMSPILRGVRAGSSFWWRLHPEIGGCYRNPPLEEACPLYGRGMRPSDFWMMMKKKVINFQGFVLREVGVEESLGMGILTSSGR